MIQIELYDISMKTSFKDFNNKKKIVCYYLWGFFVSENICFSQSLDHVENNVFYVRFVHIQNNDLYVGFF